MRYKIYTSILFFLIVFQIQSQDFEVSPVKLFFNAEPGESQTMNITLKNHGNSPQTFILNIGDYLVNKDGSKEKLDPSSTKNSCAEWLNINPSFAEVNPNEEKEIAVEMQVPNGNYTTRWGAIYVRQIKERTAFSVDEGLSAGVGVSPRIAIHVYQSPRSNTNFNAQISHLKELNLEKDSIRRFAVNIENIGGKITECVIYLIASNINTAEEFPADTVRLETYPSSTRTIELELPPYLPKGSYSLSAILDYGSAKTLEGTQIMIEVE